MKKVYCPHCGRYAFDAKARKRREEARWQQFMAGLTRDEKRRIGEALRAGMFSDDIVDPTDPALEALGIEPLPRFGEPEDPDADIPLPGTPIASVPFTCAHCGKRFELPAPE